MGVHEHKAEAPEGPYQVQVVVVSSTRTVETDETGAAIAALAEEAGHRVTGRQVVADDLESIRAAVRSLADDQETEVVILTGGTGLARSDVTPDALVGLLDRVLPGFGELFRALSFEEIGSAAMMSRAMAGVLGKVPVFALPGSEAACRLAMTRLILPELGHVLRELARDGGPKHVRRPSDEEPVVRRTVAVAEDGTEEEVEILDDDGLPPPSGNLGRLGMPPAQPISENVVEEAPSHDISGVPYGWLRAVREIRGEVLHEKREEIPWDLEEIAPVMNVLETAGEQAVLQLPSGRKYSLWGWPDLQRPRSKVLAIGWGKPLAEVAALHRYPTMTGLCIEGDKGLLPAAHTPVGEVCEAVTGRVPRDTSGTLFAVTGTEVYLLRERRVFRWDGRRESDQGTPKQVLATLMIAWSNR